MGEQDGPGVGHPAKTLPDLIRGRGVAPFRVELRDVGPVDPGDLGEAVTERADADAQDAVAGRQRVDDRGLEAAGSGRREHRDVGRRPEERLDAVQDPLEHRGELRAAMVDHLPGARGPDTRRQRGRAGDAEIRLETVHS